VTKRTAFAAVFIAICAVIGVVTLGLNPPDSKPEMSASAVAPPAPVTPPSSWPDYGPSGPGFVAPAGAEGDLVALGYKLVTETYALIGPDVSNPAMRFAGNNLSCQDCHLNAGTVRSGLPLVGAFRKYPWVSPDGKRTVTMQDRLNECMTHSMDGKPLPIDSREMNGLMAYLKFIGGPPAEPSQPMPRPPLPADAARGAEVYAKVCVTCHREDGQGARIGSASDGQGYRFPPLWGPDSFNSAAGMNYVSIAAKFVQHNMPRGVDPKHPQLDVQQAWDVAAYLHAQQRPVYPTGR
jgi:thiosulfate dehydrogenase